MVAIAAVLGNDRFPSCQELMEDFGSGDTGEGINLFTNVDGVNDIKSTDCIDEDHR